MKLIVVSIIGFLSFGVRGNVNCSGETRLKSLDDKKQSASMILNEDLFIPKDTRAIRVNNIVFVLKNLLVEDSILERGTNLDLLSVGHTFIRARNEKINVFAYFMKNDQAESIQNKTISNLEKESLGHITIECKNDLMRSY